MPKKAPIAAADASDVENLSRQLLPIVERSLVTPTQYRSLVRALSGYLPARFDLSQRTPHGAVYVHIETPDDTFALTMSNRGRVSHG
jgi:hypothetical protein